MVDKKLDKMKNYEDWDEGIEVDIKTESPLHVLLPNCRLQEELVGHVPQTRGYHQTYLRVNIKCMWCLWVVGSKVKVFNLKKITPIRSTKMT